LFLRERPLPPRTHTNHDQFDAARTQTPTPTPTNVRLFHPPPYLTFLLKCSVPTNTPHARTPQPTPTPPGTDRRGRRPSFALFPGLVKVDWLSVGRAMCHVRPPPRADLSVTPKPNNATNSPESADPTPYTPYLGHASHPPTHQQTHSHVAPKQTPRLVVTPRHFLEKGGGQTQSVRVTVNFLSNPRAPTRWRGALTNTETGPSTVCRSGYTSVPT